MYVANNIDNTVSVIVTNGDGDSNDGGSSTRGHRVNGSNAIAHSDSANSGAGGN